jgi:hypothetical protein
MEKHATWRDCLGERFARQTQALMATLATIAGLLLGVSPSVAQTAQTSQTVGTDLVATQNADLGAAADPISDYFNHWFQRVDAIQAQQPHWMTPVATTTPRLEEEFRYDQMFETLGHSGGHLDNFDGGKGLELIPFDPVEVIVGMPPYIEKSTAKTSVSGFNDWPFLLIKYRLLSANEQNGNYIVSAFLQGSAPTGIMALTSNSYMITPTIAAGIGLGDFDIQTTLGESFPLQNTTTGKVMSWNTTLQYHVWSVVWPEVEFNYMHFSGGERDGFNQAFVTPGVVFGRFPLFDRVKLIVGGGYQFAVMPSPSVPKPLTPMYKNNFILTTRFAF